MAARQQPQDPFVAMAMHFNVEGEVEITFVLYLSMKAPFDMMDYDGAERSEVKPFVRRVLVVEVRGVVAQVSQPCA